MDRKWCVLIGPCQSDQVAVGSIRMSLKPVLCFLKGSYMQILRLRMHPVLKIQAFHVERILKVLSFKD